MSLEIVRQVNAQHPELLQQNINSTCYQFVVYVVEALTAAGHRAYLMCKSPGEGQYTPPGFVPRDVVGLDGKTYPCSGVSHDAIWCDDQQYDTIARGNDSPNPIYNEDGSQMTGEPAWNEVPSEYWRPNNPPLTEGVPPPVDPATVYPYPDEPTTGRAYQDRVHDTYEEAGRDFPDPADPDAFRHFMRYGYSCHEMPEPDAANKHIAELRVDLKLPPEEL
jgi:hypothetical protein